MQLIKQGDKDGNSQPRDLGSRIVTTADTSRTTAAARGSVRYGWQPRYRALCLHRR